MPTIRDNDQYDDDEFYLSVSSPTGRYAGIFELMEGAAHFYLYDTYKKIESKIIGNQSVRKLSGEVNFDNLSIDWDEEESFVDLLFEGELIARFYI